MGFGKRLNQGAAAFSLCLAAATPVSAAAQQGLQLSERGYFSRPGLDVIVFSDIYPEGHQTGVTVDPAGRRVAANGDLRLEVSPGQWSPVPGGRAHCRSATGSHQPGAFLSRSDRERARLQSDLLPRLDLSYRVTRRALLDGDSFRDLVDLDRPVPPDGSAGSASISSSSPTSCSARPG